MEANQLIHATENIKKKPFLKAHMANGDVAILKDTWIIDSLQQTVSGTGDWYDLHRHLITTDTFVIHIDSVVIFETNKIMEGVENDRVDALTILAGVDVIIGVICLAVPKACFGSCPTFYIGDRENVHLADAEGFSNAIAPSLEYADIDALINHDWSAGHGTLYMKNEALETHCINQVNLLAVPKEDFEQVFQSPTNTFYRSPLITPVTYARGCEGDITDLLNKPDHVERFSLSDPNNLSSKEEIFLEFECPVDETRTGLVLDFRQTLMTTHLIYSAIGYMGDEVGDLFAQMERSDNLRDKLKNGIQKELGRIDVFLWSPAENDWIFQDGFYETGPIAINRQIIPFDRQVTSQTTRIKLVLNRGLWRLDYAALASIGEPVTPEVYPPTQILQEGMPDPQALGRMQSSDEYLVTMPGSEYEFRFEWPDDGVQREFFLSAQGYYLEWMRESWIRDKDLLKLRQMIESPRTYLRAEAGAFKHYEAMMEDQFWNSRIDTKIFSIYEK